MTGISKPGSRWLPVRADDFEAWQVRLLEEAAQLLGVVLESVGRVHRPYSVGSPVMFRGERAWLRVGTFLEHEMNPNAWRGTADAAAIPGVSKPALLHYGAQSFEFTNISPTIHGTGEVLPSQSWEMLRAKRPYTGCNAGITHFHADPHGKASICKVGRDPQVDLIAEGADGLRRLAAVADSLVTRHGGCSGCTLQKTCGTCMPLATLYRQAKAPLKTYCQHGGR